MQVLPIFAMHGSMFVDDDGVQRAREALEQRLVRLFTDTPTSFRRQNGGDYPDKHTLAAHVAPGVSGLAAHLA